MYCYTVQSILRRVGIRQLPGICWYPAKCAVVMTVNQGGTADKCIYSSLTDYIILSRAFFVSKNSLAEVKGGSI